MFSKKQKKQIQAKFGPLYANREVNQWIKAQWPDLYKHLLIHVREKFGSTKVNQVPSWYLHDLLYPDTNRCRSCGEVTKWERANSTYRLYCGYKCMANNPEVKAKKASTCEDRYGVSNPFASEKIKKKITRSIRAQYGVDNISQNAKIKRKKERTCLKNYGVKHHAQSKQGQKDRRKTNIARYGVPYTHQNPEILAKMLKKRYASYHKPKEYRDQRGKLHKVLGYEHLVLAHIDDVSINKIISNPKKMPAIPYVFEGKERRYFPDFKVRKVSKIELWEVKSTWTLFDQFELNLAKFRAAIRYAKELGGNFYLAVSDRDGNVVTIKNPKNAQKIRKLVAGL